MTNHSPNSNNPDLYYFNINWLSETDGPGKRLVLFLQGCNLNCSWCHSPHSRPIESPLLYFDSICLKCKRCIETCNNKVHSFINDQHIINRDNCSRCGKCIEACPQSSFYKQSGALILPTQRIDVDTLFEKIKPHLELLKDEGGITFSGGEALLQSKALAILAKKCKESGIHTALETSGVIPTKYIQNLYPFIDTWLVGMRLLTGSSKLKSKNLEKSIHKTLAFLTQKPSADIIIRIPVIPDYTTSDNYLITVNKILKEYQIKKIDLLPYNPDSDLYYKAIDLPYHLEYNQIQADKEFLKVANFFNIN